MSRFVLIAVNDDGSIMGTESCGSSGARSMGFQKVVFGEEYMEAADELFAKVKKLEEKIKNQKDRIRILEGPTNHAGGLK